MVVDMPIPPEAEIEWHGSIYIDRLPDLAAPIRCPVHDNMMWEASTMGYSVATAVNFKFFGFSLDSFDFDENLFDSNNETSNFKV